MTEHTCARGTSGGPEAISAAFVPGRILLVEPSSGLMLPPSSLSLPAESPIVGDFGPICTSVKGGGLGSRGELDGETGGPLDVVAIFEYRRMLVTGRSGGVKRSCVGVVLARLK